MESEQVVWTLWDTSFLKMPQFGAGWVCFVATCTTGQELSVRFTESQIFSAGSWSPTPVPGQPQESHQETSELVKYLGMEKISDIKDQRHQISPGDKTKAKKQV